MGPISRSGRSPGGGHGNPLHYSCLEAEEPSRLTVHRLTNNRKQLKPLSTAEHTNKDLPHSTENSTQCSAAARTEGEVGGEKESVYKC